MYWSIKPSTGSGRTIWHSSINFSRSLSASGLTSGTRWIVESFSFFNWVAIGTKLGYEKVSTPKELLEKDFDTRLNQFLESAAFYAEKLNIKPGEMWWDGSQMRYSNTPYVKSNIEYKKKELPKEMSHPQKEEIKKSTFSKRPVK